MNLKNRKNTMKFIIIPNEDGTNELKIELEIGDELKPL